MKKRFLLAGCVAAGLCACAPGLRAADPDTAWRESARTVVGTNSLVVATDTNAATIASSRTPAYAGQLLFGRAGAGTNAVWAAKGLTTNDWVRLAP